MTTPDVCVVRLDPVDTDRLRGLQASARRVHRSFPQQHPSRINSSTLSHDLAYLHFRGVRIEDLAQVIGTSHQAVRARIQSSGFIPVQDGSLFRSNATEFASPAPPGTRLVTDSGVHRRLLVHDTPPVGMRLAPLPVVRDLETLLKWLDSTSGEVPLDAPSATPLRVTPVYVADDLIAETLTAL